MSTGLDEALAETAVDPTGLVRKSLLLTESIKSKHPCGASKLYLQCLHKWSIPLFSLMQKNRNLVLIRSDTLMPQLRVLAEHIVGCEELRKMARVPDNVKIDHTSIGSSAHSAAAYLMRTAIMTSSLFTDHTYCGPWIGDDPTEEAYVFQEIRDRLPVVISEYRVTDEVFVDVEGDDLHLMHRYLLKPGDTVNEAHQGGSSSSRARTDIGHEENSATVRALLGEPYEMEVRALVSALELGRRSRHSAGLGVCWSERSCSLVWGFVREKRCHGGWKLSKVR